MRNKKTLLAVCERPLKAGLLFLPVFISLFSFAQNKQPDSLTTVFNSMYMRYMNGIGGAAALYNGAEYEGSYPRVLGRPFLAGRDFQKGTLCYEGVVYYNVLLAYDLVRGELLTKSFQQLSQRLEKAKVNYFVLTNRTYVHLHDTLAKNSPTDDFYGLLFDGPVRAYSKSSKSITKAFNAESADTITGHVSYFLYDGAAYYSINNDKDLLQIFGKDKDVIKAFWKEQKLTFKKEPETFITQTLTYWSGRKK